MPMFVTPRGATYAPRRVGLAIASLALLAGCTSGLEARSASQRRATTTQPTTTTTTAPSTTAPPTTESDTTSTAKPSTATHGFPESWQPEPLAWSDCGSLECAELTVPLDWNAPDGETISLPLNRRPATGERTGAVLVNPGGPGASGKGLVENGVLAFGAFDRVSDSFDIVGWDPRGVSGNSQIDCGTNETAYLELDPGPDDATEQRELDDAASAVAQACDDNSGKLLPHISTDDSVRDMEAIRRALGDPKLSYYGFSYGTALGSQYADWFPDRVRAIVLDGVVDPTADLEQFLSAQTAAFDRQVREIFATCGGLSTCPVDDPAAAWDKLAAQLETAPIAAAGRELGPAELQVAAVATTYVAGTEEDLMQALADALDGDPGPMLAVADIYYGAVDGFASYLAIECVDQPRPNDPIEWQAFADRLEKISPLVGASVANELLPCATWPVAPVREPRAPKAIGAPPILVVGNSGDAATPIEQARDMAASLESGVLVESEGLGHTSYGNPCVDAITAAYLADLTVPTAGTQC